MNQLLPITTTSWETHYENNMASTMIIDGLKNVHHSGRQAISPSVYEMDPIENQISQPKTENILTAVFSRISKTLKASA